MLNHQMFAFCPMVNQQSCGVSDDAEARNMTLIATEEQAVVSSTDMRYRLGRPEYRQFDACYYLIQADLFTSMQMMDGEMTETKEEEEQWDEEE